MKKLTSLFFVLALSLFLAGAVDSFAKPGGVKVDDDRECDDVNREVNMDPGDGLIEDCVANLWYNEKSTKKADRATTDIDGNDYSMSCNNGNSVVCDNLYNHKQCSDQKYGYEVHDFCLGGIDPDPDIITCTITVYDTSDTSCAGGIISQDSWRQSTDCSTFVCEDQLDEE